MHDNSAIAVLLQNAILYRIERESWYVQHERTFLSFILTCISITSRPVMQMPFSNARFRHHFPRRYFSYIRMQLQVYKWAEHRSDFVCEAVIKARKQWSLTRSQNRKRKVNVLSSTEYSTYTVQYRTVRYTAQYKTALYVTAWTTVVLDYSIKLIMLFAVRLQSV